MKLSTVEWAAVLWSEGQGAEDEGSLSKAKERVDEKTDNGSNLIFKYDEILLGDMGYDRDSRAKFLAPKEKSATIEQ